MSPYIQEEKRRFKGRGAAAALPLGLLANFPRPGTGRDVVRGRKDQGTAHRRMPPADYSKSRPCVQEVPLPPMAGLFLFPAMNRLLTPANRDRPRHPERGSSPNATPLP
jgi:hypothetical protein